MRKKEVFGMRRKWNEKQNVLLILGICMAVVGILVIVLIPIVKRGKGSRSFENLTKEKPCEELGAYANSLLDEEG